MKAIHTKGSRTMRIIDLPDKVKGLSIPPEIEISIRYTADSNVSDAIALDNVVIPEIVRLINNVR